MKKDLDVNVLKARRKRAEKFHKDRPISSVENPSDDPALGADLLVFKGFTLDLKREVLSTDDREIELRPKAFTFLRYFASNPRRLITKEELLENIWPDVCVSEDSVVQCVSEIRRAFGHDGKDLVKTVPRRGYRFEAIVQSAVSDADQPEHWPSPPIETDMARPRSGLRVLLVPRWSDRRSLVALGLLTVLLSGLVLLSGDSRDDAPPLSLVVLPFQELGGSKDKNYLALGISNDLTFELAKLPGTFVISSATARTFSGTPFNARRIGRQLRVRYLIKGTLIRQNGKVRIAVELIDSANGATVWARRFLQPRDSMTAWRNDVMGRIATSLNFRMVRLESDRVKLERPDDPIASDFIMKGWALIYAAKKPKNYRAARDLFRRATERDPRAVNAHAGIGWTSAILVLQGWSKSPRHDAANARAAAMRALAIDPENVIALHVQGFLFRLQRRTKAAGDAFRKAISINRNFAPSHAQLGQIELELGRPKAAIAAVTRALRISPRDPSLGPWLAFIGMAHLHLGQDQSAASWLQRAIDTGTPVARHHAYLASALALAGRTREARAAVKAFVKKRPLATLTRVRASARSTNPKFLVHQERFLNGLRLAGLSN